MFDNFPLIWIYQNVAEAEFHENPRWPPRWPPYEPHGTRFDLGTPKILELDTITITKM